MTTALSKRTDGMWSTAQAAAFAGEDVCNVNYWAYRGLLPGHVPAKGTGSDRRYTYEDLVILLALSALRDMNMDLRRHLAVALRQSDLSRDFFMFNVSPVIEVMINLKEIRQRLQAHGADYRKEKEDA